MFNVYRKNNLICQTTEVQCDRDQLYLTIKNFHKKNIYACIYCI